MTEPGRGDDGVTRSTGTAAARGAALVAAAVLLGLLLLSRGFDSDETLATNESDDTDTTQPEDDDVIDDDDGVADSPALPDPTPETPDTLGAAPREPSEVQVLVANGSDVGGAAQRISDEAAGLGYTMLTPTNAEAATSTAFYFVEGYQADAQALASALGAPPEGVVLLPDPPPVDPQGANLVVVLAADVAAEGTEGGGDAGTGATEPEADGEDPATG
ncbi:hypothetical protein BH24ACT3_BH24ACT3_12440 [soil metagenome]